MSHSRKHSGGLLKWQKCQNWEYQVTTKGGHLRKHSGRLLKQQKMLLKDGDSEVNKWLTNVLRYKDRMLGS